MKKYISSFLMVLQGLVLTLLPISVYADHTSAHTGEQLQQQIVQLQQQVVALQAQITSSGGTYAAPTPSYSSSRCQFLRDLTMGSKGEDVRCLQQYLIEEGEFTYATGATGYFGAITKIAVASWQNDQEIFPAAGYFGPLSQARYIALAYSSAPSIPTPFAPAASSLPSTNITAITANNGAFNPSFIQVKHLEDAVLSIIASDRDYIFRIPEGGINAAITKGKTTSVSIGGLGVGTYTFDCGSGCKGTLTVIGKADTDAD